MSQSALNVLRRTKARIEKNRRNKALHFAVVVPDRRAFNFMQKNCFVVVPATWRGTFHAHVVMNKEHSLSWAQRALLADLQLVSHEELGFTEPIEVTLGWPEEQ